MSNIIKFFKTNNSAVTPSKAHPEDIGYDLTAIKKYKEYENGAVLYDTGIRVQPPQGFYTEIIPRSSISKSGYMLANSIGIIDPNYTGNLYIALIKVNPSAKPLKLPFTKCQLVLRKAEKSIMKEVNAKEFMKTTRGDGGFGSTGKQ